MEIPSYFAKEYFDTLKEELRIIRNKKKSLKYCDSQLLDRLKQSVDAQCTELDQKYSELRRVYKKRFDHLEINELVGEYKKKVFRIISLEKRMSNLKILEDKICIAKFRKRKQLKRILYDFENPDGEFARRRRDFEELYSKMLDKGILIEHYLMNPN